MFPNVFTDCGITMWKSLWNFPKEITLGVWNWQIYTTVFQTNNQQRLAAEHRECCSIFCDHLKGKRIWKGMDMCVCITDSFAVHLKVIQHC